MKIAVQLNMLVTKNYFLMITCNATCRWRKNTRGFLKPVINCVSAHHVNYQRRKTKLKKLIKKMRTFL